MKIQTTRRQTIAAKTIGMFLTLMLSLNFVVGINSASAAAYNVAALTEAIAKTVITKQENNVTKYSTGPKSVTVTYEIVRLGKTRKANKADEYEGIPAGATVYPVRAKYTVVQHYGSGDKTTEKHYDYDFYENNFGGWETLGRGPVR